MYCCFWDIKDLIKQNDSFNDCLKIRKPADNVNSTKVFKEDKHGSIASEAQMNRRSLLFIVIGLISIILVSSLIAYELGFIKSSGPSANSSGALWQRPIENFANSLAADDGKVFTTDNFDNLNCFDSQNGKSIWNGTGDFYSGALAVLGSQIYVGLQNGRVGCLDENTGKLLWTFQNEPAPNSIFKGSPEIIVKDGQVFAISDTISAHNATTGELLWQASPTGNNIGTIMQPNNTWTGGSVTGYPLNGDPFDGSSVYVTTGDSSSAYFFKLDTDNGTVLWRSSVTWNDWAPPEVNILPSVLATSQGQVIIENMLNSNPQNPVYRPTLLSLNSTSGKELWSINVGATWIYNPTVYNNLLLFAASNGYFYALNLADGTIAWKTKVDIQNLFSLNQADNVLNSTLGTSPMQIDSQNQRLFWSFAGKQGGTSSNYTGILCSLDLANGNVTWTKQIEDTWVGAPFGAPLAGLAVNNGKIFLTGNNALWIFNASTGDLVQSQQFDHYITPPIVLGNETFVATDLWLTAYA